MLSTLYTNPRVIVASTGNTPPICLICYQHLLHQQVWCWVREAAQCLTLWRCICGCFHVSQLRQSNWSRINPGDGSQLLECQVQGLSLLLDWRAPHEMMRYPHATNDFRLETVQLPAACVPVDPSMAAAAPDQQRLQAASSHPWAPEQPAVARGRLVLTPCFDPLMSHLHC